MPLAERMRRQVETLTADLIGVSLCNNQNFPSLRDLGHGIYEIGISNKRNISNALRNVSYRDVYDEIERTQTYNLKMLDGALIQMMYRFKNDEIIAHRLAFFPSPYLEEFQNNPDIYLEDEIYAEVVMKNIVPFPVRFDFDSQEEIFFELTHPKSHLTLGQYKNCRIPVSAPLTPYYFISFLLRSFYHTAYLKYSDNIRQHSHSFLETIAPGERGVIHIQIPVSNGV
jgi:hypothetical protein